MSLLQLDKKVLNKLTEGIYDAVLTSIEEVTNTQGGYIAVTLEVTDATGNFRTIKDTIFPSSVDIFFNQLKEQLAPDTEPSQGELIEAAKQGFRVAHTVYNNGTRNYNNYHYNGVMPAKQEAEAKVTTEELNELI